jgi:predicted acylesterase/phospholipase RssA/outer membrane protein assembly factor BamA
MIFRNFLSLCRFPPAVLCTVLFFTHLIWSDTPGKGIALVLSGGGSRGLAQIGAIKALEQSGLKPDLIVATSMGAIIGSLYASGYDPDSLARLMLSFDWNDIYSNSASRKQMLVSQKDESGTYLYEQRFDGSMKPVIPRAISEGQTFYNGLVPKLAAAQYRAGMNFDSLSIPLRIVSTDIVSGRRIVFSKGNLPTIVRASCSFPLVFSPVGTDSMLLMDGGLSSNIPVEAVRDEFPGYCIVAIDVTSPLWEKKELNSPVRLVDQIVNIGLSRQKAIEKTMADVLITPDCSGIINSDFTKIDTLIVRGYDATMKRLAAIRNVLDSLGIGRPTHLNPVFPPFCFPAVGTVIAAALETSMASVTPAGGISPDRFKKSVYEVFASHNRTFARITSIERRDGCTVVSTDPGVVRGFAFRGNFSTRPSTIRSALCIRTGDTLTTKIITKALSSLYATELFKNVNIMMDTSGIVTVLLTEKDYWLARVGARFDDHYLLEGYVQPGYENLFGTGTEASLHLQYGSMREKYALEILDNHIYSQGFANKVLLQTYISRESIIKREEAPDSLDSTITRISLDERTLGKGGFLGLIGAQIGKFFMLDGGIRIERFQLYQSKAFKNPFGGFERGLQYFMLRLTADNLDKFPFPEKGQKDYISIGDAHDIIGGTENFLKIDGSFSQYFTFAKIHTFSPQIQFVWANDSLPEVERVYLGGVVPDEKYREIGVYNYMPFFGLKPRALPGDVAFLFRGQYRGMIQRGLYVTASLDWGYSWQWSSRWLLTTGSAKELWHEFLDHAPVGMGLGMAYESIVGPIRFSWGRLIRNNLAPELNILSENLFYLSIGHDF